MKNNIQLSVKFFIAMLVLIGAGLFLSGCGKNEDDSTLPWAQPSQWENNKMPGMMPNYGDRDY